MALCSDVHIRVKCEACLEYLLFFDEQVRKTGQNVYCILIELDYIVYGLYDLIVIGVVFTG